MLTLHQVILRQLSTKLNLNNLLNLNNRTSRWYLVPSKCDSFFYVTHKGQEQYVAKFPRFKINQIYKLGPNFGA